MTSSSSSSPSVARSPSLSSLFVMFFLSLPPVGFSLKEEKSSRSTITFAAYYRVPLVILAGPPLATSSGIL